MLHQWRWVFSVIHRWCEFCGDASYPEGICDVEVRRVCHFACSDYHRSAGGVLQFFFQASGHYSSRTDAVDDTQHGVAIAFWDDFAYVFEVVIVLVSFRSCSSGIVICL